jgi:glycosyltransferase involved in cell wall biosynthesis
MSKFRMTVFTPTFNRARPLSRVYDCLSKQTCKDFEWLIVDDGSTDDTHREVVTWQGFAKFPIRYAFQQNQGKHVAFNLAVRLAEGKYFLPFDSDDLCVPTAVERFLFHWSQIEADPRFANVSCLSMSTDGNILGERYPAQVVDEPTFWGQYRFLSGGERWGVTRTEVLREFPFPEGERYVLDGLIWNRIANRYSARFVNEALKIYILGADSLSHKLVNLKASSPKATSAYYRELAFSQVPNPVKLKAAINWATFRVLSWSSNPKGSSKD